MAMPNQAVPLLKILPVSVLFLLTTATAFAQYGRIAGIVTDLQSGKPLSAATVMVSGTGQEEVTDRHGRFYFSQIPVGSQTLSVDLLGYKTGEVAVVVIAENPADVRVPLQLIYNDGDRLFVRKRMYETAQTLADRRRVQDFGHVATSDDIYRSADYSIRSGLARLPGVQMGRRQELNLRGAGRDMYTVTMDGQMVASTVPYSREVDLAGFSADLIQSVELIKVRTPEMDAEGLSGVVNLNTWRPAGEREIHVRAGGIAHPKYNRYTGLGHISSLHYSERYRDDFSLALNLSQHQSIRGHEVLAINFDAAEFDGQWADVVEQLSPGLHANVRNRFAGAFQLTYEPHIRSSWYVRGVLNSNRGTIEQHRNISTANGDWIDPFTTGQRGQQGRFSYNPMLNRDDAFLFMAQVGGRHAFDLVKVDYHAGWAHSNIDRNHYDFLFSRASMNYAVNMENRSRPEMLITNIRLLDDGSVDERTINFISTDRLRDEHTEDRYSVRLNLEVPVGLLSFRFGGSGNWTLKNRSYELAQLATLRTFHLQRFSKLPRSSFNVFDQYLLPSVVHIGDIARYVDTTRPEMRLNEDDMYRNSLINNFRALESVYGGYGTGTLQISRFEFSGGVRVEHSHGRYDGERVQFNRFDRLESVIDTSSTVDHLHLFPYLHVALNTSDRTVIKMALTQSIRRPHYTMLTPFELTTAVDTTRFSGNTDLDPVFSNNLDVMLEHYFQDVGVITAGAFYKEITNRPVLQERLATRSSFPNLQISGDETVAVTERTWVNSDEKISLYGVELFWRQHLRFLPGFLARIGLMANYTWTHSARDNIRDGEELALRYQSPHVVNAALDYNHGRFSGQITWHWSDAYLFREADERRHVPAVNPNETIYLDLYEDGWMDLSATFGLRLSDQFRFWAHASNLLPSERIRYGHSKSLYPFESDLRESIRISAGLQFSL